MCCRIKIVILNPQLASIFNKKNCTTRYLLAVNNEFHSSQQRRDTLNKTILINIDKLSSIFNFIQEHLSLVKSKMLRQRRQGGDQEEMGGYYIGEVNEVILFSFFFDNASLFLAVLIIWILIQIRIRLKTLLNKGQQHTQTQKRWRQVLETFIWHAPLYIRFEHK